MQIPPRNLPPTIGAAQDLGTVSVPADLPPPVRRYLQVAFGEQIPRVETMAAWGRARARKPFGLLAPMGSAATAPSALPLVLLHDFYFVRRADTTISILVDGKERQPDTLPLPIDGARMYFTRYSPDVLIATLNPAHQGALMALARVSAAEARADELIFDLIENHGQTEIAQMRRAFKDRTLTVDFTPSVPNVLSLIDGAQTRGLFTITGDPAVGIVTGSPTNTNGHCGYSIGWHPTLPNGPERICGRPSWIWRTRNKLPWSQAGSK